jgi:hypothetical protein
VQRSSTAGRHAAPRAGRAAGEHAEIASIGLSLPSSRPVSSECAYSTSMPTV